METGPWYKVTSERLMKHGTEPVTPALKGKWLNHRVTEASSINVGTVKINSNYGMLKLHYENLPMQ